jgi:hypothetical protein
MQVKGVQSANLCVRFVFPSFVLGSQALVPDDRHLTYSPKDVRTRLEGARVLFAQRARCCIADRNNAAAAFLDTANRSRALLLKAGDC